MKRRLPSTSRLAFSCASAIFAALLAPPATQSATLYWDTNGATPGSGGASPSGLWDTSGTTWSTDSTGATAPTAHTTAGIDDLIFSAGTDATGSYTVTLGFNQTAKSLTFQEGTATIGTVGGGNTLTLAGGGGITVNSTTTGATISSRFTLNGHNIFHAGSGSTLTVNGTTFTRGPRASLNVRGDGIVAAPVATGTLGTALSGPTIAPWASIGNGASTRYATLSAGNIASLGYTGGPDGTAVPDAPGVTDTGGTLDYDVAAAGTLGAGASVNTLRYTGAGGDILGDLATKGIMNVNGLNVSFAGAVTAGAAGNELVINAASGSMGLNGIVTGSINKTGPGTVILSGTPLHAIGAWTVNEGTLGLNSALVAITNAEVIPGGTINSGGTARLIASNKVVNGAVITINAGGSLDLNGQSDLIGGISGAGSVITTGAPIFALGNAAQTFSGVISGGLSLTKRTAGDQILSGANTFTGTTTLLAGAAPSTPTLTLGNSLALQNSALDTTNSIAGTPSPTPGGLRTTVTTLTLGGLIGNKDLASVFRQDASGGPEGTTDLGGYSGVTALTLNPAASAARTYTAVITDGAAGMTLTKTGAGTQVLTGVNTYSGATAVSNGTLLVNSPGSLAATSAVTVAAGAALGGNGTINGTVNLSADGLLAPGGAGTIETGPLIGTLTLANNSASSLTLNGRNALLFDLPNTVTTGDLINITGASGGLVLNGANYIALKAPNGPVLEGSYTLMNYTAQTGSGTLTFQNGTTTFGNATLTVGPTSVTLAVGPGGLSGLNTWSGSVSGIWDGGTLNWTKDGVASSAFTDGDAVTFDDSGAAVATISSAAPVSPAWILFNNNAKNYTVSAIIAGGTTLAKTGSGTTTLTGVNTFTGAITISGGTLGTSGSGRLGTLANNNYAGAISIAPGAVCNVAGAGQRLSGPITGGGTLRNSSGNDLILENNGNSYGSLSLSGGRTFINNNAGALPAAAVVTVTGGNLVFGFGTTRNNAISVSSGGILTARNPTILSQVTLPGSGTIIFNNDDANTNLLTIGNDQTLTGPLTVQIGGPRMTATTAALGGVTLSGKLTGSGPLTVTSSGNPLNTNGLSGTGVLTLTGINDYTGDTIVNSGTLAVTGTSLPDSGRLVIDGGKVALTNTETVGTLFLGAVQQPSGTYSAGSVPPGATITSASFSGTGTLTVGPAAGFSAWITGTFAGGATVPALQQGPNADPDNDGIPNLVEYAIAGEDPTVPNGTIGSFNGTLLSFPKRPDASGLIYAIQESTDLGNTDDWDEVTHNPPDNPYVNNATTISYTLKPGTPAKHFLRLKVTATP